MFTSPMVLILQVRHKVPLHGVSIPRSTLRKIMKMYLGLKPSRPGHIHELDLDAGEAASKALLRRSSIHGDFSPLAKER